MKRSTLAYLLVFTLAALALAAALFFSMREGTQPVPFPSAEEIQAAKKQLAEQPAPKGVDPVAWKEGKIELKTPDTFDRVIVRFKEGTSEVVQSETIARYGGQLLSSFESSPYSKSILIPESNRKGLAGEPGVAEVQSDEPIKMTLDTTVGQTLPWSVAGGVGGVGADAAWGKGIKGKGIKVAVIDSGIDLNNHDFDGAINPSCSGSGLGTNRDSPADILTTLATIQSTAFGHGTHVAGIIAARDNGVGVVGVAPEATLCVIRVLDDTGGGTVDNMVWGIRKAVASGVQVINLSIGTVAEFPEIKKEVQKAIDAGIVVVAAAGNKEHGAIIYPAKYSVDIPGVIAVTAVDQNYYKDPSYEFPNGPQITLSAPGVGIRSDCPPDWKWTTGPMTGLTVCSDLNTAEGTGVASGSSMAAPSITGQIALLLSQTIKPAYDASNDGRWQPPEVMKVLKTTAVNPAIGYGRTDEYGHGIIITGLMLRVGTNITFSCTNVPADSEICPLSDTYILKDTNSSLVGQCSVPVVNCEYKCQKGFRLDNGSCVPKLSVSNVTIDNSAVISNAKNQYTITVTASDVDGGNTIKSESAMINYPYPGGNNAPPRGLLGWSTDNLGSDYPQKIPCGADASAGSAGVYSGGWNNGGGKEYVNLVSCSTAVSGNARTASFVVTFNPKFATDGPASGNRVSGNAGSNNGLSAWSPFGTFSVSLPVSDLTVSLTENLASPTVAKTYTAGDPAFLYWQSANTASCTYSYAGDTPVSLTDRPTYMGTVQNIDFPSQAPANPYTYDVTVACEGANGADPVTRIVSLTWNKKAPDPTGTFVRGEKAMITREVSVGATGGGFFNEYPPRMFDGVRASGTLVTIGTNNPTIVDSKWWWGVQFEDKTGGFVPYDSLKKYLPDLVPSAITLSPTPIIVGTEVTFSAEITNDGNAPTGAGFTDSFQFNKDSRPVTFDEIDSVRTYASGALASKESNTATATYTFLTAGTWYVRACADVNALNAGAIAESDEDNCGDWIGVTVTAPVPKVDGGWSAWSPASCPTTCGLSASSQTRTCTNPAPSGGGAECAADADGSTVSRLCLATAACTCSNGANNPLSCDQCSAPQVWNTVSTSCVAPLGISTPANSTITLPTTAFTVSYALTNGTGTNTDCYLLGTDGATILKTDLTCGGTIGFDTPNAGSVYGYYIKAVKAQTGETKLSDKFTVTVNPPKVDGGWSAWSPASCPTTCGLDTSSQTRTCTSPVPSGGGAECTADGSSASRTCDATPACACSAPLSREVTVACDAREGFTVTGSVTRIQTKSAYPECAFQTSEYKSDTCVYTPIQCPSGEAYDAATASCIACGNGGCTGAGGTPTNPTGSLVCNNRSTETPTETETPGETETPCVAPKKIVNGVCLLPVSDPPTTPEISGLWRGSTYLGGTAPANYPDGYQLSARATSPSGLNLSYYFEWQTPGDTGAAQWSGWTGSGGWGSVTHYANYGAGIYYARAWAVDASDVWSLAPSAWTPFTLAAPGLSVSCAGSPGDPYIGQSVTWSATVTGGSGSYIYEWNGTDDLFDTVATVQKTYTTPGRKQATLAITDAESRKTASATCTNNLSGISDPTSPTTDVVVKSCTASLTATPSTVEQGLNTTLSWAVSDGALCASACAGSGFDTGGEISGSAPASTLPTPPTTSYTLTCTAGTYGPPAPANATVTVIIPEIIITVNGQTPGGTGGGGGGGGGGGTSLRVDPTKANNVTLSWTPVNPSVGSCVVTKDTDPAWKKSGGSSGSVVDSVTTQTTYTVDCTNKQGAHSTKSVVVNALVGYEEF